MMLCSHMKRGREITVNEVQSYDEAVKLIKTAILQSQFDAARSVNEKQARLDSSFDDFNQCLLGISTIMSYSVIAEK